MIFFLVSYYKTNYVADVPIVPQSLVGMPTYRPGQVAALHPFLMHQQALPESGPTHVPQSHTAYFHSRLEGLEVSESLVVPGIPVPFPDPAGDYTVLIRDWYKSNHTKLKAPLDSGRKLPFPDGILINGRGPNGVSFNVEQGKTYRLRISNVGLQHFSILHQFISS
ncbi:hypothetical protein POM88_019734 [Heracleum sosnowskyi]|uniref:Plastocyanin-like domain-containing protein n=1 Tax=Heracleum sosnowskyi TaxID=360622 RepID=A0AAD8IA73_9APIA|nr:hypothetical protein POM88_019734 [Heracleum sosnowskyi]